MNRRSFLQRGALAGGALFLGPLHVLGARAATGQPPASSPGYGPLMLKGFHRPVPAFNLLAERPAEVAVPSDAGNQ